MRWYFLSDKQDQIPTSEEQFPALAGQGVLRAQTLVWHEGMADWKSLGELKPELFGESVVGRSAGLVSSARVVSFRPADALARRVGWIICAGVFLQLFGLLGLIEGIMRAVAMYQEWNAAVHAAEPIKPTVTLAWIIAITSTKVIFAALGLWLGGILALAAARIRQGHRTGDTVTTEDGLRLLGAAFILFSFGLILVLFCGVAFAIYNGVTA